MKYRPFLNAFDPKDIRRSANLLKKGGLVAFPTETVYGLGADAFNAKAVCRIFEAKKRPAFDPLIVHVAGPEEAKRLWKETPPIALKLMKKFWPGPLTLVLPKSKMIPDVVTAGLSTVAVRMPDHPAALSLIRALGRPIAAPSANTFGHTSPTSAQHVLEDLGKKVDAILEGGPARIGVESTVLKIEGNHVILLRPGGIPLESIRKVARVKINSGKKNLHESPGLLMSHYAPRHTPLFLSARPSMKNIKGHAKVGALFLRPVKGSEKFHAVQYLSRTGNLYEAASNLFEAMRKLDKMGLDRIVAQTVPARGIGLAILDRLKKASGGKAVLI